MFSASASPGIDLLALHARQVGLDDPGALGLLDVHHRDERRAAVAIGAALNELGEVLLESFQLAERIPALDRLGSGVTPSHWEGHGTPFRLGSDASPRGRSATQADGLAGGGWREPPGLTSLAADQAGPVRRTQAPSRRRREGGDPAR